MSDCQFLEFATCLSCPDYQAEQARAGVRYYVARYQPA